MTYLLALALGALYCFGFAPFDFFPATALSIAGLFWLLHRSDIRPLAVAWLFGVGKYAVGASWVYVSIHVYGNAPPLLAGALVVLFVATLAALFVLPLGAVYARLRPQNNAWGVWDVVLFAGAWFALDWVSTWLLTGFPWLLPGYAFMQTYTLSLAPVVGVLGLGFFWVIVVAALCAFAVGRRWRMLLLAAIPLVIAGLLVPLSWVAPQQTKRVGLVQGNIDQARK